MRRLEQCRQILTKYLIYAFPLEVTVNHFCDLINFQHLVTLIKIFTCNGILAYCMDKCRMLETLQWEE